MTPVERVRLERYLKKRFNSATVSVRPKGKSKDSAELHIDDEFVGTISKDVEDGELSYHVTMTVLEMDLED